LLAGAKLVHGRKMMMSSSQSMVDGSSLFFFLPSYKEFLPKTPAKNWGVPMTSRDVNI
jgi:hypothetical protein